jgi:hypothetical protein
MNCDITFAPSGCYLKRRRESHKKLIQGAASSGNAGDDHNRNTGGYQRIFDRRHRQSVRKETLEQSDHSESIRDAPKTFIKRCAAN